MLEMVFGKLTIIGDAPNDNTGHIMSRCRCECGRETITRKSRLISGETKSCNKCGRIVHGNNKTGRRSKEYRAWTHIKDRCNNPTCKSYKNYGAKGIKICERWTNSFSNFLRDVGFAPSTHHTLDRFPNNKGNYEPGNVRWATMLQQQQNRTNNVWLEYNGERKILTEWSRVLGVDQTLLSYHITKKKRTIEEAIKIIRA